MMNKDIKEVGLYPLCRWEFLSLIIANNYTEPMDTQIHKVTQNFNVVFLLPNIIL